MLGVSWDLYCNKLSFLSVHFRSNLHIAVLLLVSITEGQYSDYVRAAPVRSNDTFLSTNGGTRQDAKKTSTRDLPNFLVIFLAVLPPRKGVLPPAGRFVVGSEDSANSKINSIQLSQPRFLRPVSVDAIYTAKKCAMTRIFCPYLPAYSILSRTLHL